MVTLHAVIHARSHDVTPGKTIELGGTSYRTLSVTPEAIATRFDRSFEQAVAAMEELPRMFVEPDGSFVWVSRGDDPPWQLDGNLFDRDGRLLLVDIKGSCPAEEFDRLLTTLGWPQTPVMFQLVREAVYVDEQEFRRYGCSQK